MLELSLLLILLIVTFVASVFVVQAVLRKRAILRMRSVREQPHLAQVRKGDMLDARRQETLLLQQEAEGYKAKGEVLKAARTYIQAGMHRQAISVLEEAGEIERACQILFELNRPNRAGALFERHRRFEEAGKSYLKAGLQNDAARCLELAAAQNPELYVTTAQVYKSLGKTEKVLEIYARAGLMDEYVRYAYREAAWSHLRDFMTEETAIKSVFQRLDYGMMRAFVRELPVDRHTAQVLALWSKTMRKLELVEVSVKKLSRQKELINLYWSVMPEKHSDSIAEKIAEYARAEGKDGLQFMLTNAASLYECERYNAARILYAHASRHLMTAKCQAHLGELDGTVLSLRKAGESNLAHAVEEIIRRFPQADIKEDGTREWRQEARALALDLLENTTPESDESERNSPFVIAS